MAMLLWTGWAETQIPARSKESVARESLLRNQLRREDERASMSRPEFLASLKSSIDRSFAPPGPMRCIPHEARVA